MAEVEITPALIAARASGRGISCRSMVVTVFGDSVSQHGGWIWLGSLIEALAPFGYNERLVRTAVFRLVRQEWLRVNKIGRRSYYRFTDSAIGYYQKAARRIYSAGEEPWDGSWMLVSPVSVPEESRETFRKSLLWQGYNSLVSGLYAHPSSDRASLDETLREMDLVGKVVVFSASTDVDSREALKALAREKWNLGELQTMYRDFIDFYIPVARALSSTKLCPETSFLLRTLVIHDYRRILLRDPDFPPDMLPGDWIGFEAHELARRLYAGLAAASVDYIQRSLHNAEGEMPAPEAQFFQRFGGL